jgi:hypothetical protein
LGYDVYLHWQGQTEEERQAQYTGFSIVHGHVGYLREAFHGEPYAIKVLVPEAFMDGYQHEVTIPAATLRSRLPQTLAAVERRHTTIYHDPPERIVSYQKSYEDFVALAEQKERETGAAIRVRVS